MSLIKAETILGCMDPSISQRCVNVDAECVVVSLFEVNGWVEMLDKMRPDKSSVVCLSFQSKSSDCPAGLTQDSAHSHNNVRANGYGLSCYMLGENNE